MTLAAGFCDRSLALIPLFALLLIASCGGNSDDLASVSPSSPPVLLGSARIFYINSDGDLAVAASNGLEAFALTDGGGVQDYSRSPDGSLIAIEKVLDSSSAIFVISPDGSAVFEHPGVRHPLWSPDGSYIAVEGDEAVLVLDLSGAVVRTISGGALAEWSPDSSLLAVLKLNGGTGIPVVVRIDTGAETPLSPEDAPQSATSPIAWQPAGAVIAYRDKLYDLGSGVERSLPGVAVEWSPDGRLLMVALPEPGIGDTTVFRLLDATQDFKEKIGFELQASEGTVGTFFIQDLTAWSSDGRLLVFLDPTSGRERVRIYDTVQVTQEIHRGVHGERPDIAPDASAIAFMNEGKVWVLSMDGSSLNSIVDGGEPLWGSNGP